MAWLLPVGAAERGKLPSMWLEGKELPSTWLEGVRVLLTWLEESVGINSRKRDQVIANGHSTYLHLTEEAWNLPNNFLLSYVHICSSTREVELRTGRKDCPVTSSFHIYVAQYDVLSFASAERLALLACIPVERACRRVGYRRCR